MSQAHPLVPTGADLDAMAHLIEQCRSAGIEFRLVGLAHPWQQLAVALDAYLARRRDSEIDSPGPFGVMDGYAIEYAGLIAVARTMGVHFSVPEVLEPIGRGTHEFHRTISPSSRDSVFVADELRVAWRRPKKRLPDLAVDRVLKGHWILLGADRDGPAPIPLALLAAAAYRRQVTIPIPHKDIDQHDRHYDRDYSLSLIVRERVVGFSAALFGSFIVWPPPASGSTDLIEWQNAVAGPEYDDAEED